MKLTLSVRSFHVPATPGTAAWPPSLPSVPTSRATRETSSAKEPSWSTIAFTVVPMRANSPFSGWPSMVSAIFWVRSPVGDGDDHARDLGGGADEVVDQAVDRVQRAWTSRRGRRRRRARSVIRPSRPTTRPRRTSSAVELRVALDELVVGGLELAHDALAPRRETMREVARGGRAHRRLQAAQDFVLVARARGGPVRP